MERIRIADIKLDGPYKLTDTKRRPSVVKHKGKYVPFDNVKPIFEAIENGNKTIEVEVVI